MGSSSASWECMQFSSFNGTLAVEPLLKSGTSQPKAMAVPADELSSAPDVVAGKPQEHVPYVLERSECQTNRTMRGGKRMVEQEATYGAG